MTMTLPITLAIIQALLVGVADERFAIPLERACARRWWSSPSEIQRSDGRELLNLRGDALPLLRLADEFGLRVHASRRRSSTRSCSASATRAWRCSWTGSRASRTP